MSKPSFELFTAGYELNDDTFDLGEIVAETLNYEEADLGAPRTPKKLLRIATVAFDTVKHGSLDAAFGAAGVSRLRDRALMQPRAADRVADRPAAGGDRGQEYDAGRPPAAVSTRAYWRADQARVFDHQRSMRKRSQVVELAEVAA